MRLFFFPFFFLFFLTASRSDEHGGGGDEDSSDDGQALRSSGASTSTTTVTTTSTSATNAPSSPPRSFWKRRASKAHEALQKVATHSGVFAPGALSIKESLGSSPPHSSNSSAGHSRTSSPRPSLTDRVYRTDELDSSSGQPQPQHHDEMIRSASTPVQRHAVAPPAVAAAVAAAVGVPKTRQQLEAERLALFQQLLAAHNVDLPALHKLSWKGVPHQVRALVWRLLVGYLPSNVDRRESTLARKRNEYHEQMKLVDVDEAARSPADQKMWNQITIDMPRTHPKLPLFQDPIVQQLHRRLLFLWAVRHPASGYVQGINDLATPFFVVFLAAELGIALDELCAKSSIADVDAELRAAVEADTYWCFSRLLDSIQDHYTFAQPGIQRLVIKLHEIVARVDRPLSLHLAAQECQFIQFSFRWFNCLLMRELSLYHIVRTWDTYLSDDTAEGAGFAAFHTYVCAAFLCHWSKQLRQLDFQEIMLFLQSLPTDSWAEDEIETMLAQAYVWYSLFEGAQAHLEPAESPLPH